MLGSATVSTDCKERYTQERGQTYKRYHNYAYAVILDGGCDLDAALGTGEPRGTFPMVMGILMVQFLARGMTRDTFKT